MPLMNITYRTNALYEMASKLDDLAKIDGFETKALLPVVEQVEMALIRAKAVIVEQIEAEKRAEASRAGH